MYCGQLHLIRTLPDTYYACVDEILRRQRSATQASEQMRQAEEAHRADFLLRLLPQ